MEVHHHSQHPKKWKEYITEFVMLFLAVSLGFMAENIREGYVEKERAHELILQLKTEIKDNIELIDSLVILDNELLKQLDTAVVYLATNVLINGDSLFKNLPPNAFRFISRNDTYDQMKNSASLRYIKDPVLLVKILKYANDCEGAEVRSNESEVVFVTGEYNQVRDKWMPNSVATSSYGRRRRMASSIENRKYMSGVRIEDSQINFLAQITLIEKDKTYNREKSAEIKHAFLPLLARRTAFLTTVVRFMGVAKESGQDLLKYIEKTQEIH